MKKSLFWYACFCLRSYENRMSSFKLYRMKCGMNSMEHVYIMHTLDAYTHKTYIYNIDQCG